VSTSPIIRVAGDHNIQAHRLQAEGEDHALHLVAKSAPRRDEENRKADRRLAQGPGKVVVPFPKPKAASREADPARRNVASPESDLAPKADVDDREDGLRQKANGADPGSALLRKEDAAVQGSAPLRKEDAAAQGSALHPKAKEAAPGSERPRRKDLGLGVDRPRKAGSAAKQDQKVDVALRVDVERQASANVSSKQKAITSVGEDGKRGMQLVEWGI